MTWGGREQGESEKQGRNEDKISEPDSVKYTPHAEHLLVTPVYTEIHRTCLNLTVWVRKITQSEAGKPLARPVS